MDRAKHGGGGGRRPSSPPRDGPPCVSRRSRLRAFYEAALHCQARSRLGLWTCGKPLLGISTCPQAVFVADRHIGVSHPPDGELSQPSIRVPHPRGSVAAQYVMRWGCGTISSDGSHVRPRHGPCSHPGCRHSPLTRVVEATTTGRRGPTQKSVPIPPERIEDATEATRQRHDRDAAPSSRR